MLAKLVLRARCGFALTNATQSSYMLVVVSPRVPRYLGRKNFTLAYLSLQIGVAFGYLI